MSRKSRIVWPSMGIAIAIIVGLLFMAYPQQRNDAVTLLTNCVVDIDVTSSSVKVMPCPGTQPTLLCSLNTQGLPARFVVAWGWTRVLPAGEHRNSILFYGRNYPGRDRKSTRLNSSHMS